MTPMIDIVFNLVIFFLLMPFEAYEYLPTNLPQTGGRTAESRPQGEAMRIDLHDRGDAPAAIELDRRPVGDFGQLRRRLKEAAAWLGPRAGAMPVRIVPGAAVRHGDVTAAFDCAVGAGFRNIQFTVPQ
jgi:biopolymer transport protein ExbD